MSVDNSSSRQLDDASSLMTFSQELCLEKKTRGRERDRSTVNNYVP